MSGTTHARRPADANAFSRVRNAAANLADQAKRLEQCGHRLKRMADEGRAAGLSESDIFAAIALAASGRPDRAEALKAWADADDS